MFRTRFFDALSLLLPSGEAFVIDAISDALQAHGGQGLPSPALREEALRFVREEAAHQRAHRRYNERLAQSGVPVAALEGRVAAAVQELAGLPLPTRLALAEAFEHLTALLSAQVLEGTAWLQGNGREARMWRWHCEEEVGHRHVASDVARALGVGHARRIACLALAALYLGIDLSRLLAGLLWRDILSGQVRPLGLLGQAARFALRTAPGVGRIAIASLACLFPRRPA
ncbi:metal-dependent hydrolase [Acidovorax sp. NCPPB 3576]|uniref:metal-dependent hydrolase n=1 Tax=Acidovorax sp. NCPPB 3576 TaxID=2940488 RepID=UPI0023490D42|nr:metal-dependent hydrolase [Acidovorax sp. NCPPB 3576]WCM87895.1 metal-dependent hydrolase [Acidovorax sp. NCPPB 3576]